MEHIDMSDNRQLTHLCLNFWLYYGKAEKTALLMEAAVEKAIGKV